MGKYKDARARTRVGVSPAFRDEWVYVSTSSYISSGYGLYASRTYHKGDVIIEYVGKRISDADAEKKKAHKRYLFDVRGRNRKVLFVLDAASPKVSSAARYVNTTLSYGDPVRNTKFIQYKKRIYLVATRRIQPNREIISFYGADTHRLI